VLTQPWHLSWESDPAVARLVGVALARSRQYVDHDYPDAWVCTLFRREGPATSSQPIRTAAAATRSKWSVPSGGMVTFVNPATRSDTSVILATASSAPASVVSE
jgi:hypothetical protein